MRRAKQRLQKFANAAQISFAECALLHDENRLLFKQNNEAKVRRSTKSTVVGKGKMMSYEDIEKERGNRAVKEAAAASKKRGRKRKSSAPARAKAKKARKSEMEVAEDEIAAAAWRITALCYRSDILVPCRILIELEFGALIGWSKSIFTSFILPLPVCGLLYLISDA
jgi:hypothetical protein